MVSLFPSGSTDRTGKSRLAVRQTPIGRPARAQAWQWFLALLGPLLLVQCSDDIKKSEPSSHWTASGSLDGPGDAFAVLDSTWIASSQGALLASSDRGATWTPMQTQGLPGGRIIRLDALDPQAGVVVAHVWAKGLYRSTDGALSWQAVPQLKAQSLAAAVLNPRIQYLPLDVTTDSADPQTVYLAAPGGLFRSTDQGATWKSLPASASGKLNLLFTGVVARGDTVCALSQAPESMIPEAYTMFIEKGVLLSRDGGESWEEISGAPQSSEESASEGDTLPSLTAKAFTGVLLGEDGTVYVTAMDGGLYRWTEDSGWTGLGGPVDAVACAWSDEGISVASATRGVWRYDLPAEQWNSVGDEPVAALTPAAALGTRGTVWSLEQGPGTPPPPPAGGAVHLALSFHANLYHSYRGDTPDEEGYGTDLRVMRATLDWLDAYPDVRGEWDIENAFSLDDVLPREGADILEKIQARVADGRGAVRIMSWNNGALAAETRAEFDVSVTKAQQSMLEVFDELDPGVQPQECMFSPDHVGWYLEHGLEWITLFNSATPFTAIRHDLDLHGASLYNPLTLKEGDQEITLVPAYHHGDILDHGGLAAWAQQISASIAEDTLLLIHMDADSEFWVNFDQELADLQDLPFVRYTTIQDYLDQHPPQGEVSIKGDLADGAQDGFQSWAEKAFNHEIATGVAQARETATRAAALAGEATGVQDLLEEAMIPRLLALSTTHFGLAAPYLAEQRVATARTRVEEALQGAQAALEAALEANPVSPGTVQVLNPYPKAGPALVAFEVTIPQADYQGTEPLVVLDSQNSELAVTVDALDSAGDPVVLRVTAVRELAAETQEALTWRYDPQNPATAQGTLTVEDLSAPAGLSLPFTECNGQGAQAQAQGEPVTTVSPRQTRVETVQQFTLMLCNGEGTVTRTLSAYEGLPGVVVSIQAQLGTPTEPDDAESVVLTPLGCGGQAQEITWQSMGGTVRSITPRPAQESQNNWAADGWVALTCDSGDTVQVAHQVTQRSSLAFAPLRNDGAEAILAPLGTLWGDGPHHESRRTGGLGHGGIVTWMVAPQFRPSAPDWAGQNVTYRLLVGQDVAHDTLHLFAHPPLAKAGGQAL